jgi:hypothetical protein
MQGRDPSLGGLRIATDGFLQHQIGDPSRPSLRCKLPPFTCPALSGGNDEVAARACGERRNDRGFNVSHWIHWTPEVSASRLAIKPQRASLNRP